MGSRDGAVVRALTCHQCGPGLIPGVNAICGPADEFFVGSRPCFPPSTKTNISKFSGQLKSHFVDVALKLPLIYLLFTCIMSFQPALGRKISYFKYLL